eukprot:4552069-Pleurochrysis_carterae.AAC.1
MERTCRWTRKPLPLNVSDTAAATSAPPSPEKATTVTVKKWTNADPNGEFTDVPTLDSFAQMISFEPAEGSTVPRYLLFIDIHEYETVGKSLYSSGQWANREAEYDFTKGRGTYFESAFRTYAAARFKPRNWSYPPRHHSKSVPTFAVPLPFSRYSSLHFLLLLLRFLSSNWKRDRDLALEFVVFPDFGAHRRFFAMVHEALSLSRSNVLWIEKKRVGEE